MMLHELKIKYKYYVDVYLGYKTFELRKDDRGYKIGDLIKFDIVDEKFTDNTFYRITYVLRNVPEYGLNNDYCILSIVKN